MKDAADEAALSICGAIIVVGEKGTTGKSRIALCLFGLLVLLRCLDMEGYRHRRIGLYKSQPGGGLCLPEMILDI
ncbi:hypothetical protein [Bradyrhizobium sp. WSM3983]|uniref:hypothetical protein n=1 Tax=Bradyrhizobium sp. WSM3983 TaxID=1038867 RepID=UPI0004222505|nr:hypothetical protein [Bradyrhizobium sp. WSM3983]